MRYSLRTKAIATFAGVAGIALVASGCSSDPEPTQTTSTTSDEPITLTITTFGTMGLDGLYAEYEEMHPNITIEATNIDTGGNALTDWQTKQAAGAGLPDVQAVEEGWLAKVMQVSDTFTDLRDYGAAEISDQWLDWKVGQATDPNGRIIGYGTDIGPEGLCYNRDLFAAAGLPSDRDEVAALFTEGTWAEFFDVGRQYNEATGKAWYDQSGFVWNAMVNQQEEGYYTKDGELNVEGNEELKALFLELASATADGLSSNQSAWDWGGGQAFIDGSFATFVCPGWMLGVVKGNTEAAGGDASSGWDFADYFPGGAANWGGSFLTVPTTSEHPAEAAALAEWLTAPEQQVKAFQAAGTFPSSPIAQQDPGVLGSSELTEFFNDAPVGEILGSRSQGVVAQYKGPDDSVIQEQVFGPSIQALDSGSVTDGEQAWNDAIALLNELIVNN